MAYCKHLAAAAFLLMMAVAAAAQTSAPVRTDDSDGDGLSDELEQAILQRFQPGFIIAKDDCSNAPTAFAPDVSEPTPLPQTDGTIYGQVTPGQVFPAKGAGSAGAPEQSALIEVRYYHLWARDCGQRGHLLDAERVSALLRPAPPEGNNDSTLADDWKALYWFSSAHEGTVCDSSRIHTAASLQAETAGPRVWISKGKHASYLELARCSQGCKADKCADDAELVTSTSTSTSMSASRPVINLGEPGRVMNGATWAGAASWQLSAKMQKSDFLPADLDLLSSALSSGEATSLAVGPRPMTGFQTAVAIASEPPQKTGMALDMASHHTDSAIQIGAKHVRRSLKRAFTSTVDFVSGR